MSDEQPPVVHEPDSLWVHLLRLCGFLTLWVGVYVVGALIFGQGRMEGDWWPLDSGHVVPNLLAGFIQIALAFSFAFLFYKPASSWLVAKFHKHLHLALHLHRQLQTDERADEHKALHEKLDRIENLLKPQEGDT